MALTGSNNEQKIWNYLFARIGNPYGVAGIMGNMYAESGLSPINLQNTYETKLGMTDDQYTMSVDNGDYTNFVRDSAGYGLVQWTFWSLKQGLYDYAKANNKSIGDLEMQLEFLCKELQEDFSSVWNTCKNATSVLEASNSMLLNFERPADQGTTVQSKRAAYGETYYKKYAGADSAQNGGTTMSNSSLVTYTNISPNKNSPRNHAIDTITIHCIVGQWTAKQGCDYFAKSSVQASPNYVVGKDGSIGLSVDEKDRSWCSSSSSNDNRAVTIEVASDTTDPYAVTDAAYKALIKLVADICKRNGIKKLLWKADKSLIGQVDKQNMTVHRWFKNKACPGEYLYSRHGQIANEVNALLGASTSSGSDSGSGTTAGTVTSFPATPFSVQVIVSDLNYRSEPSMSGAVKGQTGKGVFTITEVKDGWGKLKSGAGWIYIANPSYCTIKGTTAATSGGTSGLPYQVQVKVADLNIRKSATIDAASVGYTGKGVFTITEEATGKISKNGATGKWGKLKSGAGWICLAYDEYTTKK